jgi:vacuolar protein-sorting-associated protein 4
LIRGKVDEYLERAEKLKTHLTKPEKQARAAVGVNGQVAGSGKKGGGEEGDEQDADVKKLRAGLTSTSMVC